MKIILDSIIFSLQKQGGISIYWKELVKRIHEDRHFDYLLILYPKTGNVNQEEILDLNEEMGRSKIILKPLLPIFILRFLPFLGKLPQNGIFHSSYLGYSMLKGCLNVITVHDLGYERGITQKGIKRTLNLFFKYFSLRKADAIICISEFTKMELLECYPFCDKKKIKVIYNGVGSEYFVLPKNSHRIINEFEKYILFVGTRYSYKQFDLVLKVIKHLPEYKLVLVGGGSLNSNELKKMDLLVGNRFLHYETPTSHELNNLYNFSTALLYLSKYEGFGIPIVEAMKSGCPFIAYSNASIPEIAKSAGIILNPTENELQIVENIRMLEDDLIRESFSANGILEGSAYSWDKCYQETKSFYIELLDEKQLKRNNNSI